MTRLLTPLFLGLVLAIAPACGGDDDGGTDGDDVIDAGAGEPDAGDPVDSGGDPIDAAGPLTAEQFCTAYEDTCGYGGGGGKHQNEEDCLAAFEGYDQEQQGCVVTHLGLAAEAGTQDEVDEHCGHAAGNPPCN